MTEPWRGQPYAGRPMHPARDVREIRDALGALEEHVLTEAASRLAETAEALERVTDRLQQSRPHEWMDSKEAAGYLRLVDQTGHPRPERLHKIAATADLPRHRLGNGYRYSVSELDEWLLDQ